jgi:hypothetical protein
MIWQHERVPHRISIVRFCQMNGIVYGLLRGGIDNVLC